ncbi:MAG: hypothetical protein M3332_12560 [Actinomycetota bacterium]|jgi:MFS family permease|nr:hypothetical protein [Actinomycetota bacterium]
MGTPAGRWALPTIAGSGLAMLDATMVNIALPSIDRDLDADFARCKWIVNAYTLTLATLILLAGTLGDHFGRHRFFSSGSLKWQRYSLRASVACFSL